MVENQNNSSLNKTEGYFLSQNTQIGLLDFTLQSYLGPGSFHLVTVSSVGLTLDPKILPLVQERQPPHLQSCLHSNLLQGGGWHISSFQVLPTLAVPGSPFAILVNPLISI